MRLATHGAPYGARWVGAFLAKARITSLWKTVSRALLAFDAFIDSSMYRARRGLISAWAAIDAGFDRLHVSGLAKLGVEVACEALTLGLVCLLIVLTFAVPAFEETAGDDWLSRTDLAVTFQNRYGLEVGKRGIKHDDAIPFDELPDYF